MLMTELWIEMCFLDVLEISILNNLFQVDYLNDSKLSFLIEICTKKWSLRWRQLYFTYNLCVECLLFSAIETRHLNGLLSQMADIAPI